MKRTSVFYFGRRIMRIRIYGISDHACKHGYQQAEDSVIKKWNVDESYVLKGNI